jgi:DNA-binding response OmpR family regulator
MTDEKEKIKIAWYENNKEFTDPVLYYLEKQGFEIKVFGFPDTAAEEICAYQPVLVIFDYRMERINGVKMFKKLQGKFEFIPVFLSIWATDDVTVEDILKAGVDKKAIFDKAIDPASFARAIYDYYINKKQKPS